MDSWMLDDNTSGLFICVSIASKCANNPVSCKGCTIAIYTEKHPTDSGDIETSHPFQQEGRNTRCRDSFVLLVVPGWTEFETLSQRFHWLLWPALHLLLFPVDLSCSVNVVWRVAIGTIGSAAACHVTPGRKPTDCVYTAFQTHSC